MVAEDLGNKTRPKGQRIVYKFKYGISSYDGKSAIVIDHKEGAPLVGPLHIIQFDNGCQLGAFYDELTPVA